MTKERLIKSLELYKEGKLYLEGILSDVDAYAKASNGAKPIVSGSVCEPGHHNLDILHLGCCSKCGGTKFSQTDR